MIIICGVMLAVSAGVLNQQPLLNQFEPASEYRGLATNFLIMVSSVSVVVGLWGIATYKVTHRVFISLFGLGVAALTVILIGLAFIFWTLANIDESSLRAVCPGNITKLNPDFDPLDTLTETVNRIDFYSDLASNFMCSPECPCDGLGEDFAE